MSIGGACRRYIDAAERWTAARVREWSPTLRENLEAWLGPSLARIRDAEWGATGRRLTGLEAGAPLDWANRHIELGDGEWAVTGIRFRGGDVTKPFVDVICTSVPPTPSGIERLTAVLPHYAGFSPLCLRVSPPDPGALIAELESAGGNSSGTVDMYVVAGRVAALRDRRPRATVELATMPADAAAKRVAEIYAELAVSRPGIAEWATPEDEESLSACAAEGMLFEARANGGSAGVAALARDDSFGLRGYCVQEICLDAEHRGMGLGTAVLRELATQLPREDDVLWGHIHPGNGSSLHNALASGREIVGGQVWIAPDGYPGMPGAEHRLA